MGKLLLLSSLGGVSQGSDLDRGNLRSRPGSPGRVLRGLRVEDFKPKCEMLLYCLCALLFGIYLGKDILLGSFDLPDCSQVDPAVAIVAICLSVARHPTAIRTASSQVHLAWPNSSQVSGGIRQERR